MPLIFHEEKRRQDIILSSPAINVRRAWAVLAVFPGGIEASGGKGEKPVSFKSDIDSFKKLIYIFYQWHTP